MLLLNTNRESCILGIKLHDILILTSSDIKGQIDGHTHTLSLYISAVSTH